jgi:hypothetical protein
MFFIQRGLLVIVIPLLFNACSSDDDPVDCETSGPVINLDQVIHATSCNTNDGSIHVSVSGGKEPYNFFINEDLIGSSAQITSLTTGSYSVVVKDANNCTASVDNIAILAEDFSFTTTLQPNTSCLSGNGSIIVEVVEANPPYTYKLGNGNFSSENFFTGLTSGNHNITVQDGNNCTVILSISIPQGTTGTSWVNDIKPILEKNCAMSGCHNGVSRSNDFREYASAKSYAKSIKTKTQDRSMPFDGSLAQNEIDLIACWVDDGALQN